MSDLKSQQFSQWLKANDFQKYIDAFRSQEINFDILAELTDQDLRDIGVAALGDRKRLLKAINHWQNSPDHEQFPEKIEDVVSGGERRQVTVLFADISGYTSLSSKLDPEDIHEILSSYFSIVDRVIHEHGGSIDKHIGDAVMAVFGAPVAHTDDPLRAVYAAIEIHKKLDNLDLPIPVHIGIASGEVVASSTGSDQHQEYTVTGSTVNLASRLDGLASSGETYVNDEVYQLVSAQISGTAVGEVNVKGFDTSVTVWSITGKNREQGPTNVRNAIPISGRTSECGKFQEISSTCYSHKSSGHLFYLRGEPGIGKSCLAESFQLIAKNKGFKCHEAIILDFEAATGREAIRHITYRLLNPDGRFSDDVLVDKALENDLITIEHETHIYNLLEIPLPSRLNVIYDAMDNSTREDGRKAALTFLINKTTNHHPQFIFIENLHWAAPQTLELLKALAQHIESQALILVFTTRVSNDPWPKNTEIEETFGKATTKINLGPLNQGEAIEMAKNHGLTKEEFAVQCWKRSGGNPLFLEQLYRSSFDKTSKSLPPTIQSVVLTRMDSLGKIDRQALQAASVMGQLFPLKFLQSIIGIPDYSCEELVRCALVRPEGDTFLFSHALVVDGVYNSLLSKQRRNLHKKIAALYADNNQILHAQHLDRAELPEAVQAYITAAKVENTNYHFSKSLKLIERASEISTQEEDKVRLLFLKGEIHLSLGHPEKSKKAYNDVLKMELDPIDQIKALIGGASASRIIGAVKEGLELLKTAESIAEDLPFHSEKALIYYYRGALLFSRGDVENSLIAQEHAIDHAKKAGNLKLLAQCLGGLGDAQYSNGKFRTAYRVFMQSIDICQTSGFGGIEVANRYMAANMRRYMNEFKMAMKDMSEAVEMTQQVGNIRAEMIATLLLGELQTDATNYEDALLTLDKTQDIVESLGNKRMMAYVLDHKARTYLGLEKFSEAIKSIEEAWHYSSQTNHSFIGSRICGTRALLATDNKTRSIALEDGEEIIRGGVLAHNHIWFLRDAIEATLCAQEYEKANSYISRLKNITKAEPIPWCEFFIERGLLIISFSHGKCSQEQLDDFIEQTKDIGLLSALPLLQKLSI